MDSDHLRQKGDIWLRFSLAWHCAHIKKYAWLFILLFDFCLMDAWTTMVFMNELGIETESHAWIRTVSYWFGPIAGPIFGKLCQYVAFYLASILAPRFCVMIGLILCISYMLGALINVSVLCN